MADFYLEEAGKAITAARWVIATEEDACEEAARLRAEAEIALTSAGKAETETLISLAEAERALTWLEWAFPFSWSTVTLGKSSEPERPNAIGDAKANRHTNSLLGLVEECFLAARLLLKGA